MVAIRNRLWSSLGRVLTCLCLYNSWIAISLHRSSSSLSLQQQQPPPNSDVPPSSLVTISVQLSGGGNGNGSGGRIPKTVPAAQASTNTTNAISVGDGTRQIIMESSLNQKTIVKVEAVSEAESVSESKSKEEDERQPPLVVDVKSRIFRSWPQNQSLPCYHPTDGNMTLHWTQNKVVKRPASQGLLFLKLLKTASSTASSIHLRIAKNLAKRTTPTTVSTTATATTHPSDDNFEICKTRHLHGSAFNMYKFNKRIKNESFLWTLLREPTARYVSEFFHFQVSRRGVQPTDANFVEFLQTGKHSNRHYLAWLSTSPFLKRHQDNPFPVAQKILRDYDFIGITERLDETVVVLMMLLRVPMADVLHLSTKTSGGYDDGQFGNKCFAIPKSNVSSTVQEFFASDEWQAYIAPERALYQAANASLDRTIDSLGRSDFERQLKKFRWAKAVVESKCAPIVKFPCSSTGERRLPNETDCLSADLGCGFNCLDQVATELDLW